MDGVFEGELCGGEGVGWVCEELWDEGGGVWVGGGYTIYKRIAGITLI